MDHFSRLSLDQLAPVLSHVDIRPRLSSCSLVSSTWRTAAARATTSIRVGDRTPWASFEQWLWAHTAKVQVSKLEVATSSGHLESLPTSSRELRLPVAQLSSLPELDLYFCFWSPATAAPPQPTGSSTIRSSSSTSASKQGLAGLTALTRLALTGSSIRLTGLSALTSLQELLCEGLSSLRVFMRRISMPNVTDAEADLVDAFPQLQRLTSLTLRYDLASTAAVSQLSALQSLQKLELRDTTADSFAALPESLTQLSLVFRQRGSLTCSNAAGLSGLTALQSLHMCNVVPLDLSLLAGMRHLRCLQLFECELAAGGLRLQVVSSFTGLTCLEVAHRVRMPATTFTAAEAAALTASSQLAELDLNGLSDQPQAYASLFPPGRQLQHLTVLEISADLLNNPAAVQQAGSCCSNLQSLTLTCAQHNIDASFNDDEGAAVVDSLAAMSAWSSLRQLQLFNAWPRLPSAAQHSAWQALGALSQLTALQIELNQVPAREDMLHLTGCTALQELKISCAEGYAVCEADLTSTVRLAPTAAG
jgi:hypothetical protein